MPYFLWFFSILNIGLNYFSSPSRKTQPYSNLAMPKRSLRKEMLAKRCSLDFSRWKQASLEAQELMLSLPELIVANCIALYAPFQNEIDTSLLMEFAWKNGKTALLPAVCGDSMHLRQITSMEKLEKGSYGILEPCNNGIEHGAGEPDLIIVPGVAFDMEGHRIGYGKGYYDRFLHGARKEAIFIGLCHDFQLQKEPLPREKHDICMHKIVTENRIICC